MSTIIVLLVIVTWEHFVKLELFMNVALNNPCTFQTIDSSGQSKNKDMMFQSQMRGRRERIY